MIYQAKDLFQSQAELVDAKVKIAATNAMDRVLEEIASIKVEIHEINNRLTAIETKLNMRNKMQDEFRNRTIEYVFKAGWLVIASVITTSFIYFHI